MNEAILIDLLTNSNYYISDIKGRAKTYFKHSGITPQIISELYFHREYNNEFIQLLQSNIGGDQEVTINTLFPVILRCKKSSREICLRIKISDTGYFQTTSETPNFIEILQYLIMTNSWKLNPKSFKPGVLETLSLLSIFRLFIET